MLFTTSAAASPAGTLLRRVRCPPPPKSQVLRASTDRYGMGSAYPTLSCSKQHPALQSQSPSSVSHEFHMVRHALQIVLAFMIRAVCCETHFKIHDLSHQGSKPDWPEDERLA